MWVSPFYVVNDRERAHAQADTRQSAQQFDSDGINHTAEDAARRPVLGCPFYITGNK